MQEGIKGAYLGQFNIGDFVSKAFGQTSIHKLIKRARYNHDHAACDDALAAAVGSPPSTAAATFEGILSARHMDTNSVSAKDRSVCADCFVLYVHEHTHHSYS